MVTGVINVMPHSKCGMKHESNRKMLKNKLTQVNEDRMKHSIFFVNKKIFYLIQFC